MKEEIDKMWQVLQRHENRLKNMNFSRIARSIFKRKLKWEKQRDYYVGVHLALCISTQDPWKQNRIRFFSPILHIPIRGGNPGDGTDPLAGGGLYTTRVDQLDWAWPITAMGGFDDCGMTWVPPAGSVVAILFQNANPKSAFYIGSTWYRDRGPENNPNWNYIIPEYDKVYKGHRKGYMVGKNDESQVLPPFNTSNYQGYDFDSSVDTELIPDAATKITYPHMYGWKTPEKHTCIMDDGDPKCNRRFKRIEWQSSMGNYFLMKDDPYHYCGEWTNPKCQQSYLSIIPDVCVASKLTFIDPLNPSEISIVPLPYPCDQGPEYCSLVSVIGLHTPVATEYLGLEYLCPGFSPPSTASAIPVDCLSVLNRIPDFCHNFNNLGKNKYHKQKQECYPFLGGKCALVQSGIQMLSRGGYSFVMDDSVEEPRERPEWERALQPFDYDGCTGNFKGRSYWESPTGHVIELNDGEDQPKIRNAANGINIKTASGNQIFLSDHSLPDCIAGESRGIHIKSTSEHTFDMVDNGNRQCSGEREGCSKTGSWANQAFIRLRSGYGLSLIMNDANSQKTTDQQYIQLQAPQTDNKERGPHMIHMQEKATGPGQVFIRAGGDYIVYSYDDMVEVIGDEKDNPSNKMEFVSNKKVVSVKDIYYNKAKTHLFWADDYIFLMAGKDCPDESTCVYPVVVATTQIPEYITAMTGLKASERVFASALQQADDLCDLVTSD